MRPRRPSPSRGGRRHRAAVGGRYRAGDWFGSAEFRGARGDGLALSGPALAAGGLTGSLGGRLTVRLGDGLAVGLGGGENDFDGVAAGVRLVAGPVSAIAFGSGRTSR